MTTILFMLTCAAAEGFLLYLVTRFARELRQGRAIRATAAVIPVSCETDEKAAAGRELRRVIKITYGSRGLKHAGSRRMAS
jgi:hypothetical protein